MKRFFCENSKRLKFFKHFREKPHNLTFDTVLNTPLVPSLVLSLRRFETTEQNNRKTTQVEPESIIKVS